MGAQVACKVAPVGFSSAARQQLTRQTLLVVAAVAINSASCHSRPTDLHQRQQQVDIDELSNNRTAATMISHLNSQDQAQTSAVVNEDNMKLPLYMRSIATLACLIILTVGVCGNLLVPLVVIKTKYLRNSTNLFLINLSVADLLVLIVCMPTVLIELHSRPETWLLGEPMCKLSNYVEMLAANGSIFTILAISFERYYAICKPLEAGYKCTRLRATIIICVIWLLASLLTSPILIMAKSSETVYIDGSLVYNCILETDTYWHKMYVFVSMFAFFCLPLLVLMLVYWLIGRRLIRETLAMSATTTMTTTPTSQLGNSNLSSNGERTRRKSTSDRKPLKSLSNFFSSLQSSCNYHHFAAATNYQQQRPEELGLNCCNKLGARQSGAPQAVVNSAARRSPLASKALSLDHHFTCPASTSAVINCDAVNNRKQQQLQGMQPDCGACRKTNGLMSLLNKFLCRMFHFPMGTSETSRSISAPMQPKCKLFTKSTEPTNFLKDNSDALSDSLRQNGNSLSKLTVNQRTVSVDMDYGFGTARPQVRVTKSMLNQIKEHQGDRLADYQVEQQFQSCPQGNRLMMESRKSKGGRFKWAKSFSVSSSASNSTHTNSTALLSECSPSPYSSSLAHPSPRSILHSSTVQDESLGRVKDQQQQADKKKFAHFDLDTMNSGSSYAHASSTSDFSSSATPSRSSKSPSPDSLLEESPLRCRNKNESSFECNRDATSASTAADDMDSGEGQVCLAGKCLSGTGGSELAREPEVGVKSNGILMVQQLGQENSGTIQQTSGCGSLETMVITKATKTSRGEQETGSCDNVACERDGDNSRRIFKCQVSGRNLECPDLKEFDEGFKLNNDQTSITRETPSMGLPQKRHYENPSSDHNWHSFHLHLKRAKKRSGSQPVVSCHSKANGIQLSELLVVQDLSKKQQMDSRRQVVVMLAFVVACFFLLFFPYRVFTIWLILSTEDQVQSLGMETYYNLTYFSRILIYLHSAINPIAYNLISTKFRRAFMSILFCRGSSSRRQFTREYRVSGKPVRGSTIKPLRHNIVN